MDQQASGNRKQATGNRQPATGNVGRGSDCHRALVRHCRLPVAGFLFPVLILTLAAASCRRSAPDAAPVTKSAPTTLEVLKEGRWLFTYVEPSGQFATTDKP